MYRRAHVVAPHFPWSACSHNKSVGVLASAVLRLTEVLSSRVLPRVQYHVAHTSNVRGSSQAAGAAAATRPAQAARPSTPICPWIGSVESIVAPWGWGSCGGAQHPAGCTQAGGVRHLGAQDTEAKLGAGTTALQTPTCRRSCTTEASCNQKYAGLCACGCGGFAAHQDVPAL